MLAVASVGSCLVLVVNNWVVEDIHEPVVVARCHKCLIAVQVYTVHVRAVLSLGVDAAHVPAQLDGSGCPYQVFGSGGSGGFVDLVSNVEVKLFVVTAARSDVGAISRPVDGLDERTVLREVLIQ